MVEVDQTDADLSTSEKTDQRLVDDQYEFAYVGPFEQSIQVPNDVKLSCC
ncbi:hypothetical protein [Laceyella putida]|uniref:Uncharacterized protein n=1 Tax=Laceyella putida TaxID=110101 RepID=A0ABW2RF09_9BACL